MAGSHTHLLDLDRNQLSQWLRERSLPAFRADQILSWIYGRRITDFGCMTNLPTSLRQDLEKFFSLDLPEVVRITGSADTTRKFLFRLADGQLVETVLIPASPALYGDKSDRLTLCVSSQVGCAYGCKFCASGLEGWKRNLFPHEILGQVLAVEAASGERVSNMVFMGMGEPFANYDHLMRAISTINAPWGIGIGARHLTVSTSGLVPRIRDFARQPLQVRLAISLHGATDEVRERIMPVNRKYPLAELFAACEEFTQHKKQFLTFEYILIDKINDAPDQAVELARRAARLRAKVNLIPYNTVQGLPWERPSVPRQEEFLSILRKQGIQATLRREKGHDISAACGQLRLVTERSKADPHLLDGFSPPAARPHPPA
ncbi:MAG: 23S rRNA (adenine(2503)-C(2))-methyltransferase RlmN [Terrimicrobiaceae bacterium]